MVKEELDRDGSQGSQELFEKAKKVDDSINDLTLRQFHARYPLQIKRIQSGARGGRRKSTQRTRQTQEPQPRQTAARPKRRSAASASSDGGRNRDAIRNVFLEFASDLAEAETQASTVKALGKIDGYVDRIEKLTAER